MSNNLILDRIAKYLILNSSFLDNSGLVNGKMGVVIFFCHYSRYCKNLLYDDFAGELLDEIYEDITIDAPIDFENGLSGIGWGIEYLIQNYFMQGNSSQILEEIDCNIMKLDPKRIHDLTFRKGILGIAYYIAYHVKSIRNNMTVFDQSYLNQIFSAISNISLEHNFVDELIDSFFLPDKYVRKQCSSILITDLFDNSFCNIDVDSEFARLPLGLENGLAGFGLKLMNL